MLRMAWLRIKNNQLPTPHDRGHPVLGLYLVNACEKYCCVFALLMKSSSVQVLAEAMLLDHQSTFFPVEGCSKRMRMPRACCIINFSHLKKSCYLNYLEDVGWVV